MTLRRARLLAAVLAAPAVQAYGPGAAAQSIVVGPQASGISTIRNGTVVVPVTADLTASGGASLGSVAARLTWSPAVLRFRNVTAGTAGTPAANSDSAAGLLRFAVANPAGVTGIPVIVNVVFEAIGNAGQTSGLSLTIDEITRAGTYADLAPITTATGALFCVALGRHGDVDNNDLVNSADALVILTAAVGLPIAPLTTANGDVDVDGKSDTRDALVVLSYAIGIATPPPLRPGVLNTGACTVRNATSVDVTPDPVTIAVGDRVPLTPTLRDNTGTIANAQGLAWLTRNSAVATVNAAGEVLGVGAGSTYVVALVSPTVRDSAAVTVGGVRRVWYVNPVVAAQNGGTELGSTAYPFSSIQQATVAAADDDTISVAVASYGGIVVIRKRLTIIGDSVGGRFPTIRNGTGPAFAADTVRRVEIARFNVEDSQSGVAAFGVDTLVVRALNVTRSRGAAMVLRGGARATLERAVLSGATFRAIDAESTATLVLRQSSVDLVSPGVGGASGRALDARWVDTIRVDTTALTTAGARIDTADVVSLRDLVVSDVSGSAVSVTGAGSVSVVGGELTGGQPGPDPLVPGNPNDYALYIDAPGGSTVRLDSASIHDNARYGLFVTGGAVLTSRGLTVERSPGGFIVNQPVVKFSGPASVSIVAGSFLDNGYGRLLIEDCACTQTATASIDSSLFEDTNIKAFGLALFSMRGGQVLDGYNDAVRAESTLVVSLVGVEVAATLQGGPIGPAGPWAVEIMEADSARADSLWIHDTEPGAIAFREVDAATAYGNLLERNRLGYSSGQPSVVLVEKARRGRVAQTVIDEDSLSSSNLAGVDVFYDPLSPGARVDVDSVTISGVYAGVRNGTTGCCCCEDLRAAPSPPGRSMLLTGGDTLMVRGSLIDNSTVNNMAYAVYANNVQHVIVRGNTLDSAYSYTVYVNNFSDAVVDANLIRGGFNYGDLVRLNYGTSALVTGNTFEECSTAGAVYIYYVPNDTVTGNVITSCSTGVYLFESGFDGQAEVSDNTVSVTGPAHGFLLYGDWNRLHVARNDVSGPFGYQAGIRIYGVSGILDSAVVDSNTVHDGTGSGIILESTILNALMRGNTVERIQPYFGSGYAVDLGNSGRARLVNNRLAQNKVRGLRAGITADTTFLDSTVIVDDSLAAAVVFAGATVVGSSNYISRNDSGLAGDGTVAISNSVFLTNRAFGVSGTAAWNVANNWWGDALGPRCPAGCDSLSLGDSLIGASVYLPFLEVAPGTPTGAPPARQFFTAATRAAGVSPARGATRFVRPRLVGAAVRRASR